MQTSGKLFWEYQQSHHKAESDPVCGFEQGQATLVCTNQSFQACIVQSLDSSSLKLIRDHQYIYKLKPLLFRIPTWRVGPRQ